MLKIMDISGNSLNQTFADKRTHLFAILTRLQVLNISRNNIPLERSFRADSFSQLRSLRVLDLSFNVITGEAFDDLDKMLEPLTELTNLSLDAAINVTFGSGFSELKNLTYLKLQGRCHTHRLLTIAENYFMNLRQIRYLDLSSTHNWIQVSYYCSFLNIYRKAVAQLNHLIYSDVSYNRELGFCGFVNITKDLPFTKIKTFKANNLNCETGIPITVLCEDIKSLQNTSITELYMDGNNIVDAQSGLLFFCRKV